METGRSIGKNEKSEKQLLSKGFSDFYLNL